MGEFLGMFFGFCVFMFLLIGIPTLIFEVTLKIINAIFGTSFGEWQPSGSRTYSTPYESNQSTDFGYREQFIRQQGEAGHLYTFTEDSRGTVINKYGAPPEDAVIITKFNK